MNDFTASAMELFNAGINAIPVKDKEPLHVGSWKEHQTSLVKPNGEFRQKEITGLAAIAGQGSGGLEVIDFDLKCDLSGILMKDFRKQLNDEQLLKKLVIQQTIGGGFHFLYRCEEIEGNTNLARREATDEDRQKDYAKLLAGHLKDGKSEDEAKKKASSAFKIKFKTLIETRGQGGYFVIAPSVGYKIIQGSIANIPVISIDERIKLFECARSFNEYCEPIEDIQEKEIKKEYDGLSPFEDYQQRGDIISVLLNAAWEQVYQRGEAILFRRPGKDRGVSASYHLGLKKFYVHTTSTEFDSNRGYNKSQVYTILNYGNLSKESYSQASKTLYKEGFGDRHKATIYAEPKQHSQQTPIQSEENFEDLFDTSESDEFLQSLRDGTFEMGLSTGMNRFDQHFRFKKNSFVIANGHDNVGKSLVMWFLMLLTAKRYNWRWIVYTGENTKGSFTRRMIEFIYCKPITVISDADFRIAKKFVYDHFYMIDNKEIFDYTTMLQIIQKKYDQVKCDGVLIDPYNSLDVADLDHEHGYHYKAVIAMQQFAKKNCSLYLNTHAVTGATRKLEDGYVVAPQKSDTEGGTKFASKAYDFLTIHRITNHEFDWMVTQIHVRKIKETETGGMPTPKDKPILLRMIYGNCGFVDESFYNPVTEMQYKASDFNMKDEPTPEPIVTNWMPNETEKMPF